MNITKPHSIQDLGEAVGVPRAETDKILTEIRENTAKLDGCLMHDFSTVVNRRGEEIKNPTTADMLRGKWKCSNCGGSVETGRKHWYELGIKHTKNRYSIQ